MAATPLEPHRSNRRPAAVRGSGSQTARPLRDVLSQLAELIETLDDDQYNTKPVTTYGGSIGGHVRHCLDHVSALLGGVKRGAIDYDDRQRGTLIETDRRAAIDAIAAMDAELARLSPDVTDQTVHTKILLTPEGPPVHTPSSIGRELAFVVSHTIHHGAMIGGMVRALGGSVPEHFGYAPSTIAHLTAQTHSA